jgi:hypothetical protein
VQVRNHLLRVARERTPSRQVPGEWLSRREVAEAVNVWIYENTKKTTTLDANYLAKLSAAWSAGPQPATGQACELCSAWPPTPN